MTDSYSDQEKIDYEGMLKSLESLSDKIDRLQGSSNVLGELSEDLIEKWDSPNSHAAKGKIDEFKLDLDKLKKSIADLRREISVYNQAVSDIDNGTA